MTTHLPITSGPIRHKRLDDALLFRIGWIHETLKDVEPIPVAELVDGVRRAPDPQDAVSVWQKIAVAYLAYTQRHPALTLAQKCEVFAILVDFSTGAGRTHDHDLFDPATWAELRSMYQWP